MTAAELIAELEKLPGETEVVLGGFGSVRNCYHVPGTNHLYINNVRNKRPSGVSACSYLMHLALDSRDDPRPVPPKYKPF